MSAPPDPYDAPENLSALRTLRDSTWFELPRIMESMRIIAGEFRSRRILPPVGDATRPITDRVKQSLFDILMPHLEAARVYDCFAGTGSLGLECISRGATCVTCFEADRSAASLLQKNIGVLHVGSRCAVVKGDLFQWFELQPPLPPERRATVVFLDPPYRFVRERPEALKALAGRIADRHLAAAGIVVFRHDSADRLDLPPLVTRLDQREYGGMAIELLQRSG